MLHLETKSVDSENVEKQLVLLTVLSRGRSWKRRRGRVERMRVFLKKSRSWRGAEIDADVLVADHEAVGAGVHAAPGQLVPLMGSLVAIRTL